MNSDAPSIEELLVQMRTLQSVHQRQLIVDSICARQQSLHNIDLRGWDLSGLRLVNLDLHSVDLRDAICHASTFGLIADSVLENLNARHSTFLRLVDCSAVRSRLVNCHIGGATTACDFSHAQLTGSRISQRVRRGVSMCACVFDGADMSNVDAAGAYLARSTFRHTNLAGARLSRADVSQCSFVESDLTRANLCGVDLTTVSLEGSRFEGCYLCTDSVGSRVMVGATTIDCCRPSSLEELLRQLYTRCGKSRLKVAWSKPDSKIVEDVMVIWSDVKCVRVHAFDRSSGNFVRFYDRELNDIGSALMDVAIDYVGWNVVWSSLDVIPLPGQSVFEAHIKGPVNELWRQIVRMLRLDARVS